jgi:hypothetical protein
MSKRRQKERQINIEGSYRPSRPASVAEASTIFSLLLILIMSIGSYVYVFDEKLDLGGDNAAYYLLGKALAQGEGYVSIWNPGNPPQNHFPPGYPVIVALIRLLVSESILAVKILNGLFFFASLVLLFFVFDRFHVGRTFATIATLAAGFNTLLLRYAAVMMSEIPFLFFSLLALYLAMRIDFTKTPFQDCLFYGMMLSLGAAYYIRTLALAVVFGVILYFLLKKQRSYVVSTAIGFFVLVLPWFLRGQSVGGNPYLQQLVMVNPYNPELGTVGAADIVKRILENLQRYVSKEIPIGCFPLLERVIESTPSIGWVAGTVILSLAIVGISTLKTHKSLVFNYLVGTFGITLLWPEVWFGPRFILAVIPLLVFLTFLGLYESMRRVVEGKLTRGSLNPLYLAILLVFYFPTLRDLHREARSPYPANWRNYFALATWVKHNTVPDAIVSCRKWEFFHLFADRKTVSYSFSTDDKVVVEELARQNVNYVVVDQLGFGSTPRYLVPAIQKNPDKFRLVHQIPSSDTYLFRFMNE